MHPHLTDVLSRLERTREALGAAVDAVPPSQRGQRPAPDSWSVAEVLEHLSIVERIFTGRMAGALEAARARGLAAEANARVPLPESLEVRMADRTNVRNAPEPMKPTGQVDAGAAWTNLDRVHAELRALVGGVDGLALSQVTADHQAFGTLTMYQWVELMSAHEARHTEQVRAIGALLRAGR